MSQHWVKQGRLRLCYRKSGQGPPVVLVQGLGLPGEMWLGLAGGLVKSGYCVVVPDNRGTGRSDAPWGPYTMGGMADDLAVVMADAQVGPALVVGLSLGGMVVQHLALRHPRLVAGLVLAATSCGPPLAKATPLSTLRVMTRSFLGDREAQQQVLELLFHPQTLQQKPEFVSHWARQSARLAVRPAGLWGQLAAVAGHSTGFFLSRIAAPAEVVTGDSDRIVPTANAYILARGLPQAALTVLPCAGHAFPLEHPAALPQAIKRLKQRVGW